jgi:hypothetical protein
VDGLTDYCFAADGLETVSFLRAPSKSLSKIASFLANIPVLGQSGRPKPERKQAPSPAAAKRQASLRAILELFDSQSMACADFAEALRPVQGLAAGTEAREAALRIGQQEKLSMEDVWAVLLDWLKEQFLAEFRPSRHTLRLLRSRLRCIAPEKILAARSALAKALPAVGQGLGGAPGAYLGQNGNEGSVLLN